MNQSDYIALAALAVSVLAAVYARWAAKEAKRANAISLHSYKVGIYEEVLSFVDSFRGFLGVPSEGRLEEFRKKAVQRAEIYLSKEAHLHLQEIYKHCRDSEMWLSVAESEGIQPEDRPDVLEVKTAYQSVVDRLYLVIERIKAEAKLEHA
jgi:hypothetical protein